MVSQRLVLPLVFTLVILSGCEVADSPPEDGAGSPALDLIIALDPVAPHERVDPVGGIEWADTFEYL